MAQNNKRLGAETVAADTDKALYTCPASTETIVSAIVVCNQGASTNAYRIAFVDGAIGSVANSDYIAYDTQIAPNKSEIFNIGAAMEAADTILVRSDSTDVNFVAFGVEIT